MSEKMWKKTEGKHEKKTIRGNRTGHGMSPGNQDNAKNRRNSGAEMRSSDTVSGFLPSTSVIEAELEEERRHIGFMGTVRSTVFILIVAAAVAILVAMLILPVLRIYGTSMQPTLKKGNIVLSVKSANFQQGDIIAFYYNNNVLVKRVIAKPGDLVNIDKKGNVYINNRRLNETYLSSKAYGDTNIRLPFKVPSGRYFVMGDNRQVSLDSRNRSIGCIPAEQVVGKIVFRIWPLTSIGSAR